MITLNGSYGKGTLLGTMYLPDVGRDGMGYCDFAHLDYMLPPSDWLLPPPDGVMYPVMFSKYGPKLTRVDVGDIISVDVNSDEWNPCKHSTITGDALYLGKNLEFSPYWRKPATPVKSQFTATNSRGGTPPLSSRFLTNMVGRPSKSADLLVHSYTGAMVSGALDTINGADRYWFYDSSLPGAIAPSSLRSALLPLGDLYRSGDWYARGYLGALATDPYNKTTFFKADWSRPKRTTFVRSHFIEYHEFQSYTPYASRAYTGYGNVRCADHRITTCEIEYVRSPSKGHFEIYYALTSDLSWLGWQPYDYFRGSLKQTVRLIGSLLILEPGLTTEADLPLERANKYCTLAKERSALMYASKDATCARTAAVKDVQELKSNWIENLAGVKGTTDCVKPLITGYDSVLKGDLKLAKKALAGSYLTYKYVISPAISDYGDIKDNAKRIFTLATRDRFSKERRRGMFVRNDVPVCESAASLSYFTTLHLKLKNNYFSEIWSGLEKLGIDPTAGNGWDLIPLSFVADWFLPLGRSIKAIDQYNSLVLHRDLLCRIESFKVQWPIEEYVITDLFDSTICSSGSPLKYSWYDRRIHGSLGLIDPLSISSDNARVSSQMLQGAALLTLMR